MVKKYFSQGHEFLKGDPQKREDFKKQLRFLIIVTLGFTIAFSWRQTIFDAFLVLAKLITHVDSNTTASIYASIFITIASIFLIWFVSKILPDNPIYR